MKKIGFLCLVLALVALMVISCASEVVSQDLTSWTKVVVEKFQGYDAAGKAIYETQLWTEKGGYEQDPTRIVLKEAYQIINGTAYPRGPMVEMKFSQFDRFTISRAEPFNPFVFPLGKD